jgi:hypothetical protein
MLTRGPFYGAAFLALIAIGATGCGSGSKFENNPRPPAPVQLTGVITEKGVTISPKRVGGGPVRLIISNQTQDAHTITLDGGNTTDTVGPINPLDTATLQQTLVQGRYQVKAGSSKAVEQELKPGKIEVGPPRKSSSSQVLLP